MIQAAIFDMDGVLIDSEPFWRKAELSVFASAGIYLKEEQFIETMGMRTDEVVAYRCKQFGHTSTELQRLEEKIHKKVMEYVYVEGVIMPGVVQTIELFRNHDILLALASSSTLDIIYAVLDKLSLKHVFPIIHSAEKETYGKPHPAVYKTTASLLGIKPEHCLAIEDSVNGFHSAKAAGMKTIVVPDPKYYTHPDFSTANLKLSSLLDFSEEKLHILNTI